MHKNNKMKKALIYSIIGLSALTAISCDKQNDADMIPSGTRVNVTIKGGVQEAGTKVTYTPNGTTKYDFTWSVDDKVSLIVNDRGVENTNNEYTATTAAKSSPFTGSVTTWSDSKNVYSVFPYNNATAYTITGAEDASTAPVALSLLNRSVVAGDGEGKYANTYMTASAANITADGLSSMTLNYHQVMSIVKLSITGVKSGETVTAVGMEFPIAKIPTSAAVTLSDGVISSVSSSSTALYSKVTGATAATATTVDFALFPHDYTSEGVETDKLKFYVETTDGSNIVKSYLIKNIDRKAFLRNTIYTLSGDLTSLTPVNEYTEGSYTGYGIRIGATTWAPVNCGYDATNYKYGKLYQWGRKDGQGWGAGTGADATYPSGANIVTGPVDLTAGQNADNAEKFYKNSSSPYDWLSPKNDALWNSGTEAAPVKTLYDPCPTGWRIPTMTELYALMGSTEGKGKWDDEKKGRWFDGTTNTDQTSGVFLPAAGYRVNDGNADVRGSYGLYWSSTPSDDRAYGLSFSHTMASRSYNKRAFGFSVRCVRE